MRERDIPYLCIGFVIGFAMVVLKNRRHFLKGVAAAIASSSIGAAAQASVHEPEKDDGFHATNLIQVASDKGVTIGAATGGTRRIADRDYMEFCLENSSCLNTLSGFYPWNLQPQRGRFDFQSVEQLLDMAEGRPVFGSFAFYYKWPLGDASSFWMNTQLTPGNCRDVAEQHLVGIAPVVKRMNAVAITNEDISPDGKGWRNHRFQQAFGGDNWHSYIYMKSREILGSNTRIFYSENDMEGEGKGDKREALLKRVDALLARHSNGRRLIDGVALQGHLRTGMPLGNGEGLDRLLYELIEVRGLEVRLTEIDHQNESYEDLAAYQQRAGKDMYRLFSIALNRGVRWFTFWDLRNDYTWLNDPGIANGYHQFPLPYQSNGRPSTIAAAVRDALA